MLELGSTRDLEGTPVNFSKLAPGGFIVVDVNGKTSLVSREQWKRLPKWDVTAREQQKSVRAPSYEVWVMAVLSVAVGISCAIAFVLAAIGRSAMKLRKLRQGDKKPSDAHA